ncbi:hypothetical protein A8C56_18815 [Niabella ginsenosidivorans]|uniref:DUF1330 domain-containing protein n=1 Tax=Niabella ginsenosidivorans TaxID=1176587 RepID=A0A1A9I545_9BACT|nr:DUF1330 domain-containing protein [Niabella ginsenosidivorans]ANH82756.1 hypothetical protein A8C56_18815 [Niabella ginsenosidivorans]
MIVYYINSYDIEDEAEFEKYPPKVRPLLEKYGAEVLASDTNALPVEGTARKMNAIIKFPSLEAALQCYNDPEYAAIKEIRHRSVKNCTMVLVKAFEKEL